MRACARAFVRPGLSRIRTLCARESAPPHELGRGRCSRGAPGGSDASRAGSRWICVHGHCARDEVDRAERADGRAGRERRAARGGDRAIAGMARKALIGRTPGTA